MKADCDFSLSYKAWSYMQAAHQQVSQRITDPRKVTAGPWWPSEEPWDPHSDPEENLRRALDLIQLQIELVALAKEEVTR